MSRRAKNKINKAKIVLVIIVIVVLIFIIGININHKNNKGNNLINQAELNETIHTARKELEYYVKNIMLEERNNQTILKLDIENQNPYELEGKLVNIIFTDKNGNKRQEMALYIRKIGPGETISTQATMNLKLTEIYNFKIEERR